MAWTAERNGIIVTLRDQQSGELYTTHVGGPRTAALREVATWIDRSGRDWRLCCYSSPHTILGDLRGRSGPRQYAGHVESKMLRAICRLDLLDPSLSR